MKNDLQCKIDFLLSRTGLKVVSSDKEYAEILGLTRHTFLKRFGKKTGVRTVFDVAEKL